MFAKIARNSSKIVSSRKFSAAGENLEKTAFYDLHVSLGGKIVPFAGYSLPVQYDGLGVLKEHVHTRSATGASLFDVSHMGQIKWHGKDALAFVEKMVVGDIASLKVGEAKLSLVMNEQGTIMDDTVITNAGDHLYMVVNGACKVSTITQFTHKDTVSLTQTPLFTIFFNSTRTWTTSTGTSRAPAWTCRWSTSATSSSSPSRYTTVHLPVSQAAICIDGYHNFLFNSRVDIPSSPSLML